jgi:hypothetical protein
LLKAVTIVQMKRLFVVVLVVFTTTGCVHKPFAAPAAVVATNDCNGCSPTFLNDIQPILKGSCAKAGCHDGAAMPQDFSVYADIQHYLEDSAVYYSVIINRNMPEDGPLDSSQFKMMRCWLKSGYPNN